MRQRPRRPATRRGFSQWPLLGIVLSAASLLAGIVCGLRLTGLWLLLSR